MLRLAFACAVMPTVTVPAAAAEGDDPNAPKGHTFIPDVGRFDFEADQRPVKFWMYDFGGQFNFSKRFQVFVDVGTDFHGGYIFALGPTARF